MCMYNCLYHYDVIEFHHFLYLFLSGKVSMDSTSPDFVPSVFTYNSPSTTGQKRIERYTIKYVLCADFII